MQVFGPSLVSDGRFRCILCICMRSSGDGIVGPAESNAFSYLWRNNCESESRKGVRNFTYASFDSTSLRAIEALETQNLKSYF